MNYTPNYALNQWEASDRVQRADFNADNAKIDAAIKAEADARTTGDAALQAAINGKADASAVAELAAGQLRMVTGSYTGTNKYGLDHPNTLTFPFPPIVVGIVTNKPDAGEQGTIFIRGQTKNGGIGSSLNSALYLMVSWEGNSVSWGTTLGAPKYQLNLSDTTYFYFALG